MVAAFWAIAPFFCASLFPLLIPSTAIDVNVKEGKLRLFIVGDTGGTENGPTQGQLRVAHLMTELAQRGGLNFVLNLGDNFYDNGVTEGTAKIRFKTNFENVFGNVGPKEVPVPWYTIAGNNDYKAHENPQQAIGPQIQMTNKQWIFPSTHYTLNYTFGTNNKKKSVCFVMIDTTILCGKNRKEFKKNGTPESSAEHMKWLEKELESANEKDVDFLFVAGHYPLYLVNHKERSFTCAEPLNKLLSKYNVSAYFSGHEHNLKHLVAAESGIQMFVSGAGSRMESAIVKNHIPDEHLRLLQFSYPNALNGGVDDDTFGGGFIAMEIDDEKKGTAKIDFYAAGNIHQKGQYEFLEESFPSGLQFKYSVKLKSRKK